ncbi:tetratricopeptide repeat protein [Marinobacter qingdaonensis]|uniref:Tetratricopeptide repeat protein n=1 Tax=Marinobacter qingdaonensis TaxID=3108486 RepID=A0ABU5P1C4_9GAMM|nr:tetratricopeptide repeat protein [Marinobacter sp. ASW11-75]MEA1081863.1 tetratricopeptide repeat protein [Marinobacter sp. ASW11-75]
MKSVSTVRSACLALVTALTLAACGSGDEDLSQQDIQFLSHVDQSRFYQRQGELKASTQEARSAIELQPDQIEPYFLIIDNLLTAGDAVNAERQLRQVLARITPPQANAAITNRAQLIFAEAALKQGRNDEALAALADLDDPAEDTKLKAALLKGQIHLNAGNLELARTAFLEAKSLTPSAVEALVGLSKVSLTQENRTQAGEYIRQAEDIDQNHAELWLWKAQLAHLEERWQAAEDGYIRALEDIGQYDLMTARKYATITALIEVLRAQRKFSEAYVYEEILAKSPPGKIRSNLMAADEALRADNLAEAERYLQEILAQTPSHEQSTLMLGLIRFRQGRPEEAQDLLAPIASMGNSEIATKMLAATMLRMGNPEGAQSTLAKLQSDDSDPEVLTLVAIAALENGDVETGEALMEKALAINPDNHELRLRYAGYLTQRGEYDRALAQAGLVRKHAPDLAEARHSLITAYAESGDIKTAEQAADRWIKEQPNNVQALLSRGNLAARAGNTEQARSYFERARQTSPQSIAPTLALGRLALVQGDRSEAGNQFRRAVEQAPDNAQALQGLISVQERAETRDFMRGLLDRHPQATGPRLILLEFALLDDDTDTVNELTASLLERSSANTPAPASHLVAEIYGNVVTNLKHSDRSSLASSVLERAQVLFPENERIQLLTAEQAFANGDREQAMTLLASTRQQFPNSPGPYLTEAGLLESAADYLGAAELYEKALAKLSRPDIVTGYVRNLQRSGRSNEALEFLEAELGDHPNNLQLRLHLALLQQSTGKEQGAMSNYEVLLAAMPDNTVVLNNLAWLYHKVDDPRAVKLAQRAYELSPDNAAIADTYGWIMLQAGNHQESVPVLEKAHELQPDSEEIARHLAEAYRVVGMNSAARRILEKFGEPG